MRTVTKERVVKRRTKYPWEKWGDGEIHTATRDKDFTCGVPSFVTAIHHEARSKGKRAETSVDGDVVTFAILPVE